MAASMGAQPRPARELPAPGPEDHRCAARGPKPGPRFMAVVAPWPGYRNRPHPRRGPTARPARAAPEATVGWVGDSAAYRGLRGELDEPSLEEGDWRRDLDGPETLRMVGHLADVAYGASRSVSGISCQHAIPDAAKPQLDVIADLLADAGRKLSALIETPGRAAEAASPAQHDGPDFPAGPTSSPPADSARPAVPGTATAPAPRPPKPSP